jgi:hypothetical protein
VQSFRPLDASIKRALKSVRLRNRYAGEANPVLVPP